MQAGLAYQGGNVVPVRNFCSVVMQGTSNAVSDIVQAYSLHASSYLVKSSGFYDFLEEVEAFLRY